MTYTTKQGDMWDQIAYNELGSVSYTDKLMSLNISCISYFTFPAGVTLQLPEQDSTTASTLPPWKKGSG